MWICFPCDPKELPSKQLGWVWVCRHWGTKVKLQQTGRNLRQDLGLTMTRSCFQKWDHQGWEKSSSDVWSSMLPFCEKGGSALTTFTHWSLIFGSRGWRAATDQLVLDCVDLSSMIHQKFTMILLDSADLWMLWTFVDHSLSLRVAKAWTLRLRYQRSVKRWRLLRRWESWIRQTPIWWFVVCPCPSPGPLFAFNDLVNTKGTDQEDIFPLKCFPDG